MAPARHQVGHQGPVAAADGLLPLAPGLVLLGQSAPLHRGAPHLGGPLLQPPRRAGPHVTGQPERQRRHPEAGTDEDDPGGRRPDAARPQALQQRARPSAERGGEALHQVGLGLAELGLGQDLVGLGSTGGRVLGGGGQRLGRRRGGGPHGAQDDQDGQGHDEDDGRSGAAGRDLSHGG